jgi:chromosome segregation ATPase
MKNTLDNKVDKMNDTFKRDYEKFREDTKKKQQDFESKIETDNKASKTIKKNNRQIDKLKRDLESLTVKRAQNENEWRAKNEALEAQKSKLLTQYNDLKKRMASFRNEEAKRLKELAKNSKGCTDRLKT